MTKQDRQKLSILIVLVAVLGLTVVLGYRMNQPDTTNAVQAPVTKTVRESTFSGRREIAPGFGRKGIW